MLEPCQPSPANSPVVSSLSLLIALREIRNQSRWAGQPLGFLCICSIVGWADLFSAGRPVLLCCAQPWAWFVFGQLPSPWSGMMWEGAKQAGLNHDQICIPFHPIPRHPVPPPHPHTTPAPAPPLSQPTPPCSTVTLRKGAAEASCFVSGKSRPKSRLSGVLGRGPCGMVPGGTSLFSAEPEPRFLENLSSLRLTRVRPLLLWDHISFHGQALGQGTCPGAPFGCGRPLETELFPSLPARGPPRPLTLS